MKYKIKKTLVKRNQFCEYLKAILEERLRQAIGAEEVFIADSKFIIIEAYDNTESYYGHQLVQPIGGEISILKGLKIILSHRYKKVTPVLHQPKYSEVFSTLSSKEIHRCFIAYEVLCMDTSNFIKDMANRYLIHIASAYNWDFYTFMDIIEEEYNCSYNK